MPQVTHQDITDAGFRAQQFGTPPDWDTEASGPGVEPVVLPGYVARLLARTELWARGRLGDTAYDALLPGSVVAEHVRSAELCWASGHLWKRRAGFIDSNAVSALENLAYLDRREFEAQATRAFQCAEDNMALAGGTVPEPSGSAVVMTHVVSGPFATGTSGCCR